MTKNVLTRDTAKCISDSLYAATNDPLAVADLFFSAQQKRAYRVKSPLVIGSNGSGKSVVASAFMRLGAPMASSDEQKTHNLMCFSVNDLSVGLTPDVMLSLMSKGYCAYDIWRASVFKKVLHAGGHDHDDWDVLIQSMKNNPEQTSKTMLNASGQWRFLFDDLESLREHLTENEFKSSVRDVLRTLLWIEQYPRMSGHLFLTPAVASLSVYDFPDSSKLLARKSEISWDLCSLSILLWTILINNHHDVGDYFRDALRELSGKSDIVFQKDGQWMVDQHLIVASLFGKKNLKAVLARLGIKRPAEYLSIVSQSEPSSFLNAIRDCIKLID